MEMTARRMAGIALAGFALLLVAWPPRPTGLSYDEQVERTRSATDRARRAHTATQDSLRVVEYDIWSRQLRDSVRRELAAKPAASRDRIFIDSRLPAPTRRHVESVYAASRARMPSGRTALPMFVVLDTTQSYRLGTILWVEDTVAPAPACATVMRVRVSREATGDERRMNRDVHRAIPANFPQPMHFGLCGFEAAFGPPSAAVRRWLQEREYRPVGRGYDLSRAPRALRYVSENAFPYFNYSNNGAMALDIRACAAGREGRCVSAVAPIIDRAAGSFYDVWSDWRWYGWGWAGTPDLMNALATSMGPEAFGTLWRGDATPPDSYQRLTGVPIDTLARRVLLGDTPPVRVGAGASLGDAILTLLIACVFALLAMRSDPRRRNL